MREEVAPGREPGQAWGFLSGRASRKEYWLSIGVIVAVSCAAALANGKGVPALGAAALLFQVRRLHDFGRSGWWTLPAQLWPLVLLLTPISMELLELVGAANGLVVAIAIGAAPGTGGANRFGPPPPTRLATIFTRR